MRRAILPHKPAVLYVRIKIAMIQQKNTTYHINMSVLDKVAWTQTTRVRGMCVARILTAWGPGSVRRYL